MSFRPQVEQLEAKLTPIVHSFAPGLIAGHGVAVSDNAGGAPATQVVLQVVGLPVPVAASAGHAKGNPFDTLDDENH
jgi:hypothetical protein